MRLWYYPWNIEEEFAVQVIEKISKIPPFDQVFSDKSRLDALSVSENDIFYKKESIYEAMTIAKQNRRDTSKERLLIITKNIDQIIDQYGKQSQELYLKLILIESLYAKIPQKWCLPLIERLSKGEQVDIVGSIPKAYHPQLKKSIRKVNFNNKPVWEIFVVSLINANSI